MIGLIQGAGIEVSENIRRSPGFPFLIHLPPGIGLQRGDYG
jgi:hypothetical protein